VYIAPPDAETMRRLVMGALRPASQRQHGEQSAACHCLHQSSSQVSFLLQTARRIRAAPDSAFKSACSMQIGLLIKIMPTLEKFLLVHKKDINFKSASCIKEALHRTEFLNCSKRNLI